MNKPKFELGENVLVILKMKALRQQYLIVSLELKGKIVGIRYNSGSHTIPKYLYDIKMKTEDEDVSSGEVIIIDIDEKNIKKIVSNKDK